LRDQMQGIVDLFFKLGRWSFGVHEGER
jgi:hypothetical protein